MHTLCYLVVVGRTEEDVLSSRVPLNEAHSAAVTLELFPWYCNVLQNAMWRDFPHFHLWTHTKLTKTHTKTDIYKSMKQSHTAPGHIMYTEKEKEKGRVNRFCLLKTIFTEMCF